MCGIVLMMNGDKTGLVNRNKAFTQGIIIDTLRGPHSTGLVYANREGVAETYKKPIPGYDFVNMPKYKDVITDSDEYPFLIAHNRWATKGAVNTANAHPFQHGHITGVHNGSLYSWKQLSPDQDFDTDSEYIFHALSTRDTGDVLKEIDGAFALVWHNSLSNTLHIARNDERPFYLAHIEKTNTVLGVSEEEMLDLMCARNDLKIEEKYLVNTEVELVFKLDDIHNPEVIEREMSDPWAGYYSSGKGGSTTRSGGTPTSVRTTTWCQNKKVYGLIDGYVGYSSNSIYGYIDAMDVATYEPIRINGFTKEEFEYLETKDGYFEGDIVCMGNENGDSYGIVNRTNLKFLTEGEIYEVSAFDEDDLSPAKKNWFTKDGENLLYTKEEAEHLLRNGCCTCGDPVYLEQFGSIEWWNTEPICPACSTSGNAISIIGA